MRLGESLTFQQDRLDSRDQKIDSLIGELDEMDKAFASMEIVNKDLS